MSLRTRLTARRRSHRRGDDDGQATIEAAFTTVMFVGIILILIQPTIWLYTRMVMGSAAAETARVVATRTPGMNATIQEFALRRLQAVPPVDFFRVDDGTDMKGWTVEPHGGPSDSSASVTISCRQQPMPLLGLFIKMAGMTDKDGLMTLKATASVPARDSKAGPSTTDWSGGW